MNVKTGKLGLCLEEAQATLQFAGRGLLGVDTGSHPALQVSAAGSRDSEMEGEALKGRTVENRFFPESKLPIFFVMLNLQPA